MEAPTLDATSLPTLDSSQAKRSKFFKLKRSRAAQFAERGFEKIADHLGKCEEWYKAMFCTHCESTYAVIQKCKLRVCPLCAHRRRVERREYIKLMLGDMQYPKLVTLTMARWYGDPGDGIDHLRECLTKLRNRSLFKDCIGGAYQIEIVLKETGYHIHVHLIVDMPYLHHCKIKAAWSDILGQRNPQIDIRAAGTKGEKEYVTKYVTKESYKQSPGKTIVDWFIATTGKRLFGTFGKWYNVKLHDLLPGKDEEYRGQKCPACGERGSSLPVDCLCFEYDKEDAEYLVRQCSKVMPIESRIYSDSWEPPPPPGDDEPAFDL